jgi:Histidine kinase-, DNA gyrase B-, and HSP90-like ATPase
MIPAKSTDQIETNVPAEAATAFRISDNPYILELLSTKLYENAWQSVVRELVTNALDAHRAGNITRPIEVEIVCSRPEQPAGITIIDFGAGMSPTEFSDIFLNIGRSSKADSNEQMGGYGIGALTIFAVSEQATLTTISGGQKYSYLLYRDSNNQNVPTATCLSAEAASDGEVGTSIHIPASYQKIAEIASYATELTRFVLPLPVVTGLESLPERRHGEYSLASYKPFQTGSIQRLSGELFEYYSPNLGADTAGMHITSFVSIGEIGYRLSPVFAAKMRQRMEALNALPQGTLFDFHCSSYNMAVYPGKWPNDVKSIGDFCVKLPIGTLDLPGNREKISDTDRNIDLIARAYIAAWAELAAIYTDRLRQRSDLALIAKFSRAMAFGCEALTVRPPGAGLDLETIDIDDLRSKAEFRANVEINGEEGITARYNGSSASFRKQEVSGFRILQAILKPESAVNIYYYLGEPAKANAAIRKQFAYVGPTLIRVFATQAALDAALNLSIAGYLKATVVLGSFSNPDRPVPARLEYAKWIAKPKPQGLSQVDFSGAAVALAPVTVRPNETEGRLNYYFCPNDFSGTARYFYLGLSQMLPPGVTIYYLTETAHQLLLESDRHDWIPAPQLFDNIMSRVMTKAEKLYRRLELIPGVIHGWYGDYQIKECKPAWEQLMYTQSSLRLLLEAPQLADLIGADNYADLQSLYHLLPACKLGSLTRTMVLLFPKSSLACSKIAEYAKSMSWYGQDGYWDRYLTRILAPAVEAMPLFRSSDLFSGWRENAEGYPSLSAMRDLVDSLPQLVFLKNKFTE